MHAWTDSHQPATGKAVKPLTHASRRAVCQGLKTGRGVGKKTVYGAGERTGTQKTQERTIQVCKTRDQTAASMKSTSHDRCGEWRHKREM